MNLVGFWCDSKGMVNRIRTNGTAYGQGLRLGDRVVAVDGIQWNDISKEQLEKFYTTEGHRVWKIESEKGEKDIVI